MRMHPSYTRVKAMITDPSVPRDEHGVLRLCRLCQREVYFAGGFLRLLNRTLDRLVRFPGLRA